NTSYFDYDEGNRLKEIIDPAGHTTEISYIQGDNLWKIEDGNHQTYTFDYDLADRKKSLSYPDESMERWDYDPVGNLIRYTNRAGQTRTSTFDNRDRETHVEWDDKTPPLDKTYDPAGRLLTMSSWVSVLSY